MDLKKILLIAMCLLMVHTLHVKKIKSNISDSEITDNIFNGVYSECFLHLSYTCLQRKTLLYLKELNNLSEVSVIGEYMKFVKVNNSNIIEEEGKDNATNNSDELAFLIDKAIDNFFANHIIKFNALGRDISTSRSIDEFVGRKKRKGGGGGGGDHGGDHDGKKKMMMMAMMCMKMKLMMMVPAMMGMMGMMSFKGMVFSMMSFMIAKMMLLMKLLEKRGGAAAGGGGSGFGGDGGWAASGGGGGAWMPAGGQDYSGGGYDANAQWQTRSMLEMHPNEPIVSYITPTVCSNKLCQGTNDVFISKDSKKSRNKRDIIDVLQSSYSYWVTKLFGPTNRRNNLNHPKYKIINGVKHIFYPLRALHRVKTPKETKIKMVEEDLKPIIAAEDFNKGEIFEGVVESRMNRKKFHKMKETVNNTMDDNPWE